ncbi:TRNA modification GTPase GTPBP3, mitochondrial [Aphelenchoides bicaudatus]|nr:TRNA modification GTPase GTPBP3, mitochondrial [Aphelenchoides bicaudatus]
MSKLLKTLCLFQMPKRFHSIFALSTGSLPSALAIIRITGNESKQALAKLTGKQTDFESRKLFCTPIFDERKQLIDRIMAVYLKGPSTFSGEDTVELYVHGSRAVVDAVLSTLSKQPNLEPAKAGEFTRRAFFNSKLNIAQLEALGDLLNSETSTQLRLAHRQNEAAKRLEPIRSHLVQLIARLESTIDFGEDMEAQQNQDWEIEFKRQVEELTQTLINLHKQTNKGMLIRKGMQITLVGRTNVGKSSLMNQLAARDVAIVSKIPGTTRDSLEVRTSLGNLPVTITDTAGLRKTSDELENEGIARSIKRASEAHIVVFVLGADELLKSAIDKEVQFLQDIVQVQMPEFFICINKSDLLNEQQRQLITENLPPKCQPIFVSALQSNVEPLVEALSKAISFVSSDDNELFLSNERQLHLLEETINALNCFQGSLSRDRALAGQFLQDAASFVGEITGTVVNEEILNAIFSQFCIGK